MPIPYKKLAELANRKRPTAVKKWCQNKGILYFLDADGNPCTTETALHDALKRGRKTQPNWEGL